MPKHPARVLKKTTEPGTGQIVNNFIRQLGTVLGDWILKNKTNKQKNFKK